MEGLANNSVIAVDARGERLAQAFGALYPAVLALLKDCPPEDQGDLCANLCSVVRMSFAVHAVNEASQPYRDQSEPPDHLRGVFSGDVTAEDVTFEGDDGKGVYLKGVRLT